MSENNREMDMIDMAAHRRINDVEKRLDTHFIMIEGLETSIKENTSSLARNTELTQDIANNTKELVDLFTGAKLFRKFIFWCAPIIGIAYGLFQWVKGFR